MCDYSPVYENSAFHNFHGGFNNRRNGKLHRSNPHLYFSGGLSQSHCHWGEEQGDNEAPVVVKGGKGRVRFKNDPPGRGKWKGDLSAAVQLLPRKWCDLIWNRKIDNKLYRSESFRFIQKTDSMQMIQQQKEKNCSSGYHKDKEIIRMSDDYVDPLDNVLSYGRYASPSSSSPQTTPSPSPTSEERHDDVNEDGEIIPYKAPYYYSDTLKDPTYCSPCNTISPVDQNPAPLELRVESPPPLQKYSPPRTTSPPPPLKYSPKFKRRLRVYHSTSLVKPSNSIQALKLDYNNEESDDMLKKLSDIDLNSKSSFPYISTLCLDPIPNVCRHTSLTQINPSVEEEYQNNFTTCLHLQNENPEYPLIREKLNFNLQLDGSQYYIPGEGASLRREVEPPPRKGRRRMRLELGANNNYEVDLGLGLESQEWFHGSVTRNEAEEILKATKQGSFLLRNCESSTFKGYSLSLKSARGFIHVKISPNYQGSFSMGENEFPSVSHLVLYFMNNRLPIKGAEHVQLIHPVITQLL